MAAEKAAAAPATRQAAAAQQQAVPSGHHPAAAAPAPLSAAASAPAVLPTSAAPSGRAPAAGAAELGKAPAAAAAVSRRNGGSPRAGTEAGGFAFAASPGLGGCPTPAPLGNPPRLKLGGPAQSAVQRQLDLAEATGAAGSVDAHQQQAAAASGMGAGQSAPKAVAFTSPNAIPPLSPSGAPPLSPLSATPGTPSELRAASEALLTAAAGGQPGAAPSPSREPAAFLEALLARLSQLNRDGFFENPVDEEEAPGYYDFVKQPLCFRDMRDRLRRRQYRTWGALCDDFELICANALSFNQKRSRVHRAAVTMMQAGRLLLQTSEPAGKIAIAALHPDGAKAAAADARREKFDPRGPAGGGPMLRSASSPGTPPAGLASMSLGDTATTPDASDDALRDEAMDTDDEGYSSFSDMEPDPGPGYLGSSAPPRLAAGGGVTTRSGLRAGANGLAGVNGLAGANGTKPGGGNGMTGAAAAAAAAAAALPDLGSVLKSISVGATRLLWPPGLGEAELRSAAAAALSHEEATSGPSTSGTASGEAATASDGADKPAAGGQKALRGRSHAGQGQRKVRTTAWKTARRGIEWRARWLQLRLQGLQHLRDRHAEALAELRARDRVVDEAASTDQAASPAAVETKPAVKAEPKAAAAKAAHAKADAKGDARADAATPAADLPVAMAAKQRAAANAEAAAAAAAAKRAAAAPAAQQQQQQPPPRKARRRRLPVPDVSPAELASHPWFAAHASAGRPTAGDASAAAASAAASGDQLNSRNATGLPAEDDNVWYAGRCYALLDLIDRQRIMTRRMAASMCQMQEAGQQPEAAAGRARASSGANGQRSRGGMRPGSARVRTTGPPAKPSKRRRDDVSEPGTPLLTHGIGAPKFVERQQAMEIPLPQVRKLSQAELAARRAAVAAWRARLKQQHAASGGVRPAGGKAAVAAAAGSSSEEDSGDEAFLQRHRPLEMEERQRFLSYTVGGNMKARAKGGPGHKPKPSGGNPRSAGGGRPDSAPARTATAPPALTTAPDAKSGGGTSEADAAGVRKGGTTRRTSRESEKQRNRGRLGGSTRSGSRSPLLHLQSVGAGGAQPQDGAAAEKGAEKGTAGGGAAAATVSDKGGAAAAAASGKAHGRKE